MGYGKTKYRRQIAVAMGLFGRRALESRTLLMLAVARCISAFGDPNNCRTARTSSVDVALCWWLTCFFGRAMRLGMRERTWGKYGELI